MVWQCNEKFSGDKKCNTPHITDAEIKEYFIKVVNQLIINKAVIIKTVKNTIMPLLDTNELETDAAKLQNELIVVSELMENMIYQNSHTALNQEEYKIQYNELTERFDSLKEKHNNIMQVIKDKQSRKANIESYLTTLQKQENCIDTFEISLWSGLVDYVTIYSKDDIQFTLRDGSEIKV